MNIKITDHSKIPGESNIWKERPAYLTKDWKLILWITSDTVLFKRLVLNSFIPSWRERETSKTFSINLEMGLRVFLDEITNLNVAQNDNIQKFHNLLAISQITPEGNLGVFSYFSGRKIGNRTSIFADLQTKIFLDMGFPSIIQNLLACSDSMQEDLFTGSPNNMHNINFTIINAHHH